MTFEFNKTNLTKIKNILKKYPDQHQQSAVMPLLDLAQRQNKGYLTVDAIQAIAKLLNMPYIRVHEIATFYSMYNLKPIGKYHVRVCGTTPCMLCGSEDILKTCKEELAINVGETSPDGNFTLSEIECVGACVNAPVMQVNDDIFEDLKPEHVKHIFQELKLGRAPKTGSQIGRQGSKAASC